MTRTLGAWFLHIILNLLRIIVLCLLLVSPVGLGGLAILSEIYTGYISRFVQEQSSKGCEKNYSTKLNRSD